MWDDTVIFFLGDNGAPNNNAGANTVFKGMKFSHWEGGHRVPAFIAGPAVPTAVASHWYNGTVHLVDLHATIIDLGGGVAAQPAGVKPVDGVSLVSVLNGSVPLDGQVRSELWIADDVLRVGVWKLITGSGAGSTDCMIGLGGLPVQAANDPNNLTTTCGTGKCHSNVTGPDADICWGCKCVSLDPTDPTCRPCLYNVVDDPGEFTNLASQNPARVAEMTTRIKVLALGTATPDYPPGDLNAACQAMVDAGGFYVPWAKPPPPPSPPSTLTPAELSGKWLMDGTFTIPMTTTAVDPAGNFNVSFRGCASCCWTAATGIATPSSPGGGGVIHATGIGSKCTTGDRDCIGTVTGGGGSLTIGWSCTCSGVACGAMGVKPWTKQ